MIMSQFRFLLIAPMQSFNFFHIYAAINVKIEFQRRSIEKGLKEREKRSMDENLKGILFYIRKNFKHLIFFCSVSVADNLWIF